MLTLELYYRLSDRAKVLVKNFLIGGIAKISSALISFLQIPLILKLITISDYGVWLTIYSIVGWLSFFDLGLGNGMRNKLTEAIALKDFGKVSKYTSTTYITVSIIFGVLLVIALVGNYFVDWNWFLNIDKNFNHNLYMVITITLSGVLLNFIANLIHVILAALQKTGVSSIVSLIQQIITILICSAMFFFPGDKFIPLIIVIVFVPLIVNMVLSIYIFLKEAKKGLILSWNLFDRTILKDIFTLGYKFFAVQLAYIILFSTDSVIIARLFSPTEVTSYFICFKYFSIKAIGFSVFAAPIWSSFSNAYALKEYRWIVKKMNNLFTLWLLVLPIVILMVIFSQKIYFLWLGDSVKISIFMTLSFGVYALVGAWNSILATFLNSTSEMKLQFYVAIFGLIINIPLAIVLAKNLGMGSVGVAWSTIICQLIATVLLTRQYYRFSKSIL